MTDFTRYKQLGRLYIKGGIIRLIADEAGEVYLLIPEELRESASIKWLPAHPESFFGLPPRPVYDTPKDPSSPR